MVALKHVQQVLCPLSHLSACRMSTFSDCYWSSGSQSGVHGTATSLVPWNLLEMQNFLPLLPHTDSLEAWDLIVVRALGSSPGDMLNSQASL